jgi:transcriptional regulator with XRE-family HTH domain
MDIGKRIRELREERGLSQREVARRAGLTPSGVGFIELGQTQQPSAKTVVAIARALSVPVEELLADAPVPAGKAEARPGPGVLPENSVAYKTYLRQRKDSAIWQPFEEWVDRVASEIDPFRLSAALEDLASEMGPEMQRIHKLSARWWEEDLTDEERSSPQAQMERERFERRLMEELNEAYHRKVLAFQRLENALHRRVIDALGSSWQLDPAEIRESLRGSA